MKQHLDHIKTHQLSDDIAKLLEEDLQITKHCQTTAGTSHSKR